MAEYLVNRRVKISGQQYLAGDLVDLNPETLGDLVFIGALTRLPDRGAGLLTASEEEQQPASEEEQPIGSTEQPEEYEEENPFPGAQVSEEPDIESMNVEQLRTEAERRGVDSSGTKKELRERLS